jgi:hypothetical protein
MDPHALNFNFNFSFNFGVGGRGFCLFGLPASFAALSSLIDAKAPRFSDWFWSEF